MAEKSLKKNFIYNVSYQLLMLIAPFVVTPYVSRVLGVDNIGLYSYANSIVSYFMLVAVLGTTTYAQRAIGYSQKSKEERSRKFWEIVLFRLLTSAVTLGGYMLYAFLIAPHNQRLICLILAMNIINVALDISWFLQGMEEFGKTTLLSSLFRIASIVSIFVFVKSADDLWLYVLFSIVYNVVGNLLLWVLLPKYICKVNGIRPLKDTKTILQMFLPTIAVQLYTVLDKSMLGWFAEGFTENGYYEQAEKVVKMALTAVTALGLVMIPRISRRFKEGDMAQVHAYLYKSYRFVWMLAIPIMFGLIAIADRFVPIFYGDGYEACSLLIQLFSPLVIFIGLSNVTGMQYFVPIGKQNVLTVTVVIGAAINLVLNLCLIPFFYSIGACIASVVAEFSVTIAGFVYCKKKRCFALSPVFLCAWKYWIAGALMCGAVFICKIWLPSSILGLIVLILIGIIVYFIVLLVLRDAFLLETLHKGLQAIRNLFTRKHKDAGTPKPTLSDGEQGKEQKEQKEQNDTVEKQIDESNEE